MPLLLFSQVKHWIQPYSCFAIQSSKTCTTLIYIFIVHACGSVTIMSNSSHNYCTGINSFDNAYCFELMNSSLQIAFDTFAFQLSNFGNDKNISILVHYIRCKAQNSKTVVSYIILSYCRPPGMYILYYVYIIIYLYIIYTIANNNHNPERKPNRNYTTSTTSLNNIIQPVHVQGQFLVNQTILRFTPSPS